MRFPYFGLSYLLLVVTLLTSASAWAQVPPWQNIHRLKVPGGISATVTANGFVYVAGGLVRWTKGFSDPEGGGPSPQTGYNAFVAKWNPTTHRLVWLKEMGNQHGDADEATALVVHGSSVYVLGDFEEQSAGFSHPIKSTGFRDLFVTKFTDHGTTATAEWTQCLGYAVNSVTETVSPQARHLTCDGASLYVAGTTDTEFRTWDPATGNKAPNVMRAFLAKLTDAGTRAILNWQRTWVVSHDYYEMVGLMAQRGKLFIAANTWQPTPLRDNHTRELGAVPQHYRLHLTQFSDRGASSHLDWTHTEAGQGTNLAVAGNSFYVVGREDADQPFGKAIQPTDACDVPGDLFVAKLVVAGTTVRPAWVQRLRGTGYDEDADLHYVVVRGQHVYIAGAFSTSSLAVGSIVLNAKLYLDRINSSESDLLVAQLTDTGIAARFDWAQRLGGNSSDHLRAFSLAGSRLYMSAFFDEDRGSSVRFGKQQFRLLEDSGVVPEVLLQAWLPLTK